VNFRDQLVARDGRDTQIFNNSIPMHDILNKGYIDTDARYYRHMLNQYRYK